MATDTCDALAQQPCVPCRGGVPPLAGEELATYHERLGNGWGLVEDHHLEKAFTFPNFQMALDFTNAIGVIAEAQNHHPDIHLGWGKVKIILWTHKIDGLTESDFIFAAKVEKAREHAL